MAAFLWAQIEEAETITKKRLGIWDTYHESFAALENTNKLRRPIIPRECEQNAHMYYILLPDISVRTRLIEILRSLDIYSVFHYVPLHSAPAGKRFGRVAGSLIHTEDLSGRLLRLPMWMGLEEHQEIVINAVVDALS